MNEVMKLPSSGTLIYFMAISINFVSLDIRLMIIEESKLKEMKISEIISINVIDLANLLLEIEIPLIP